jgi:hypothetical protein
MFRPIIKMATSFHDYQYSLGSKYITLTSDNENKSPSSNNSSTNFICTFNEPFYFQRDSYEVGLVGIRYKMPQPKTPRNQNISQQQQQQHSRAIEERKVVDKLFPNLKPSIKTKIPYIKTQDKITKLPSDLTDAFRKANINFVTTFGIIGGDFSKLFITTHFSDENLKKYVILPYKLATTMGFTREWFLPGTHDAYEIFTQTAYDEIPMGSDLSIHTETFQNDENLISINRIYERTSFYARKNSKHDTDFRQFFSHINAIFQNSPSKFAFLMSMVDGKVDIMFDGLENEYVVIPSKLSRMLGFSQDKFFKGLHRAKFEYNQEAFDSIADYETLYFRFGAFLKNEIPMEEPENVEPQTVISTLNKAFTDRLYRDTRVHFDLTGGTLNLRTFPEDVSIKLPKLLCEYFSINKDTIFNNGSSVQVSETIVEEEKKVEDEENIIAEGETEILPPPTVEGKRILVICDCVDNQYYNQKAFPMLRDMDMRSEYINEISEDFSPIVYVGLKSEHIYQIRITLLDEFGRQLDFGENQTLVKLHFKPKFE